MSTKTAAKDAKWTDEEKAAMKARAREMKAEERMNKNRAAGESALLEAVAAMDEPDRAKAQAIHAIVTAQAPELLPKTWYGMPAWANAEGKVVCFFQAAGKFGTRYATFGFNDVANLDDGDMWPASFALMNLTAAEEARIAALVAKATS